MTSAAGLEIVVKKVIIITIIFPGKIKLGKCQMNSHGSCDLHCCLVISDNAESLSFTGTVIRSAPRKDVKTNFGIS